MLDFLVAMQFVLSKGGECSPIQTLALKPVNGVLSSTFCKTFERIENRLTEKQYILENFSYPTEANQTPEPFACKTSWSVEEKDLILTGLCSSVTQSREKTDTFSMRFKYFSADTD
jgi:hypothetical protein